MATECMPFQLIVLRDVTQNKFLKIPKLWLNWGKSSFSPDVAQCTGHELFPVTYMSISSTQ
jgi:hypothetical protein